MRRQTLRHKLNAFRKNDAGATAIEFSILVLPFMILVFGILELALVFFTTTSLQHGLISSTRPLRVGAQSSICGDIDRVKQDVCEVLKTSDCLNNLDVTVSRVNSSQFDASVLTQFQANNFVVDEDDDTVDIPDGNVLASGISGNEILIVKAIYQHNLIVPGKLTRLSNFNLKNKRLLTVTQAVRTEPFPSVTCP